MSQTLRLFVAVDLPQEVRARLAAWGRRAADADAALRAVPSQSLHVTLAFLGQRPAAEVDALRVAVRSAGAGGLAVPLALAEALWLSPRRPHVLTVGLDDVAGALSDVHGRVLAELSSAIGWEPEPRPLRPHVTVARVRRGARPRVQALAPAPRASFVATALTLYRSHQERSGARYEVLEQMALPAS